MKKASAKRADLTEAALSEHTASLADLDDLRASGSVTGSEGSEYSHGSDDYVTAYGKYRRAPSSTASSEAADDAAQDEQHLEETHSQVSNPFGTPPQSEKATQEEEEEEEEAELDARSTVSSFDFDRDLDVDSEEDLRPPQDDSSDTLLDRESSALLRPPAAPIDPSKPREASAVTMLDAVKSTPRLTVAKPVTGAFACMDKLGPEIFKAPAGKVHMGTAHTILRDITNNSFAGDLVQIMRNQQVKGDLRYLAEYQMERTEAYCAQEKLAPPPPEKVFNLARTSIRMGMSRDIVLQTYSLGPEDQKKLAAEERTFLEANKKFLLASEATMKKALAAVGQPGASVAQVADQLKIKHPRDHAKLRQALIAKAVELAEQGPDALAKFAALGSHAAQCKKLADEVYNNGNDKQDDGADYPAWPDLGMPLGQIALELAQRSVPSETAVDLHAVGQMVKAGVHPGDALYALDMGPQEDGGYDATCRYLHSLFESTHTESKRKPLLQQALAAMENGVSPGYYLSLGLSEEEQDQLIEAFKAFNARMAAQADASDEQIEAAVAAIKRGESFEAVLAEHKIDHPVDANFLRTGCLLQRASEATGRPADFDLGAYIAMRRQAVEAEDDAEMLQDKPKAAPEPLPAPKAAVETSGAAKASSKEKTEEEKAAQAEALKRLAEANKLFTDGSEMMNRPGLEAASPSQWARVFQDEHKESPAADALQEQLRQAWCSEFALNKLPNHNAFTRTLTKESVAQTHGFDLVPFDPRAPSPEQITTQQLESFYATDFVETAAALEVLLAPERPASDILQRYGLPPDHPLEDSEKAIRLNPVLQPIIEESNVNDPSLTAASLVPRIIQANTHPESRLEPPSPEQARAAGIHSLAMRALILGPFRQSLESGDLDFDAAAKRLKLALNDKGEVDPTAREHALMQEIAAEVAAARA